MLRTGADQAARREVRLDWHRDGDEHEFNQWAVFCHEKATPLEIEMSNRLKPASVAVCVLALSASAAPVTKVTLRAPAGGGAKGALATFDQVFMRGDVKQGVLVSAAGASVQADVKRKYDDGSARFAIVSVMMPSTTSQLGDGPCS